MQLESLSKLFWTSVIAVFIVYFLGFQLLFATKQTFSKFFITHTYDFLFHSPNMMISLILITSCFYLYNLGNMFCKLNKLWKCLPSGLIDLTGRWDSSEITECVERIRLLHAEVSELLRLFSLSNGRVLLIYFSSCVANNILALFFIIVYKDTTVKLGFVPFVFFVHHIVYIVLVLSITTWVINKVN